ncbi:biotin synthase BioB [Corynebacterium liangguodongii]|uniref:Biotin synthase n=1 Tax=Corynebacterium liangguodongii TaxID=2079535 RepID=A0A2S0WBH5_9CORY|nr:biotin synthase BioB [Corynebacterium liangguodongii]AWB83118.1 biotin synthase BioB [Corynebacterium liangguodongii]PWB99281.1 biotin synthase BioB [Corynebacterium liangguodongii]
MSASILDTARTKVLECGEGLNEAEILDALSVPDDELTELLELAHQVRIKYCGVEVSLEGIISLKTGGCPEDCHFCSQSGLFESPVRAVTLNIEELVEGARQSAKMGASEFCIVAAVKGPTERLLDQVADAIEAINAEVEISISASLGILDRDQARRLREMGVSRYNHNFETARSFFPNVVTTHTWEERKNTLEYVRAEGMEVCCGGIIGLGESLAQRAEFAAQLAEVSPHEVPMNFLDPRPGTPFADRPLVPQGEALRAVAAFRLAMPTAQMRFAGGTELALGDDGTERGLLGGANAIIGGNYLTTAGRPMEADRDAIDRVTSLGMPTVYDTIKAL